MCASQDIGLITTPLHELPKVNDPTPQPEGPSPRVTILCMRPHPSTMPTLASATQIPISAQKPLSFLLCQRTPVHPSTPCLRNVMVL